MRPCRGLAQASAARCFTSNTAIVWHAYHVDLFVRSCVYLFLCVRVCVRACVRACARACMRVCRYVPYGFHHEDSGYDTNDPTLTAAQARLLEFPPEFLNQPEQQYRLSIVYLCSYTYALRHLFSCSLSFSPLQIDYSCRAGLQCS
eukprot:COSAG05_NODE_3_length_51333_cov_129.132080_6_plen_146_part_00